MRKDARRGLRASGRTFAGRATLPDPKPGPGQLLLRSDACAVCRTDLHLRDHEIEATKLPVVLGHQIVGDHRGRAPRRCAVAGLDRRRRAGTARRERENLCLTARFTGRDIDGGYAELAVADERFCLPLPDGVSDEQAAPLLCGGLIGYRALTLTGDAAAPRAVRVRLGGPHDLPGRASARAARCSRSRGRATPERRSSRATLGASWAGGSDEVPPEELDGAIIFASAGELVPQALSVLAPGRARSSAPAST